MSVKKLNQILEDYGKVAIAFSGGVDSTYLLAVAKKVLGDNVIAITIDSPNMIEQEVLDAIEFTKKLGVQHYIIKQPLLEQIADNPVNRCYICKKFLFTQMLKKAQELGFDKLCDGTNLDDLSDYRPGLKAIAELQILSPLKEAELTKDEIRQDAKKMQLECWDKAACACLLTRIPYNSKITQEKISKIAAAEVVLRDLGFRIFRVRLHHELARIEVAENEIEKVLLYKNEIYNSLKTIGFEQITLDLNAYSLPKLDQK